MLYFSSDEFRQFYKIARNYQTRSLNIDNNSVYWFGIEKEGCVQEMDNSTIIFTKRSSFLLYYVLKFNMDFL